MNEIKPIKIIIEIIIEIGITTRPLFPVKVPRDTPNAPVDTKIPFGVIFPSPFFNTSIPPPIWKNALPIAPIMSASQYHFMIAIPNSTKTHPIKPLANLGFLSQIAPITTCNPKAMILYIKKVIPYKIASEKSFILIVICAFFIVVLRSYIGTIIPVSWNAVELLVIVPSICAMLGKAIGGVLGDKFGARRVGIISLLLSIICFIIGKEVVYIGLLGILLFNITMPITLCILASKLPNDLGLAFGITTLGLLIGVIPSFFVLVQNNFKLYITIFLIIISAAFIRIIASDELKK